MTEIYFFDDELRADRQELSAIDWRLYQRWLS